MAPPSECPHRFERILITNYYFREEEKEEKGEKQFYQCVI